MNEINRMPDNQPALNELSDPLRRAVEHIRSQPAPQESMQRAVDRASAIHVAPPRRWFNLKPEIQVRIAVAAAILVALGIGLGANELSKPSGQRFALGRLERITRDGLRTSEHFAEVEEYFDGDLRTRKANDASDKTLHKEIIRQGTATNKELSSFSSVTD